MFLSLQRKIEEVRGRFYRFSIKINVVSTAKSIDYILKRKVSVIRFGDGEFNIIRGLNVPYQKYNSHLAIKLKKIILDGSNNKVLVCLPDVFENMDRYNNNFKKYWYGNFFYQNRRILRQIKKSKNKYGSAFISRPYIDLKDKNFSASYFNKLKSLWDQKELLIVEGKYTRSGENNDLFVNAKTIERIICPSNNAFFYIRKIEKSIIKHKGNRLILLMLGPTAKIIINDLYNKIPNQLIDLGHIDSEYEWFKMGATSKVKIPHKHTAEFNYDDDKIKLQDDMKFDNQIIDVIHGKVIKEQNNEN